MISWLANFLVSVAVKDTENSEEAQYREVYQYVLFIILNYILFFGYSLILGLLLGIPFQSIVFFVSLAILRRYAGGYHADTETRCLIISTSYFTLGILLIKLLSDGRIQINFYYVVAAIICALIILFLCPCDSPEKPIDGKLYRVIRIKSTILVVVFLALILVLWFCNKQIWASVFIVDFFIETGLIVAGTIKFRKRKQYSHVNNTKE